MFVSFPIGSNVVVQWKDEGPWTHGTIKGKGDHNHQDRSFHIHITNTGRLVIQNRQHIKPTQISAEQYLCEQLQKHTKTDPLENIHTQLENNQLQPILSITMTMDHTVTTPCMITKQDAKSRTILKQKVKKVMIKK